MSHVYISALNSELLRPSLTLAGPGGTGAHDSGAASPPRASCHSRGACVPSVYPVRSFWEVGMGV